VDVGLEDMRDPDPALLGEAEHAVDVTLRIHHQRDPPVMGEIAAVAQRRGFDRNDGHHRGSSFRLWCRYL
jgi:hypothetical protein